MLRPSAQHVEGEGYSMHVREAKLELHSLLEHLSFSIQTTLLEILAPVVLQRLTVIQRALPAIIPLLVGCLHAFAVYAESCRAPKLFPCVGRDGFANGLLPWASSSGLLATRLCLSTASHASMRA